MRVLLNAVSVKEGGSITVLRKLLSAMIADRPEIEWIAAVNPRAGTIGDDLSVKTIAPPIDASPAHLMWWYEFGLPAAARRYDVDAIFSVTNYLPRRPLDRPTLLLVQHAGHFSAEFERLRRQESPSWVSALLWQAKTNWVQASVKKADVLTVQTAALADAISSATQRPRDAIRVIPHGPGWVERIAAPRRVRENGPWRIGYVSKWSFHKSFETLLRAIQIVDASGLPTRLVLTVDPTVAGYQRFLAEAQRMGIRHLVENRGLIAGGQVAELYDSLDIFVFPSVCESFGMPMVEAMARGLPTVVAATPENREVTGGASLTFATRDAEGLAAQLMALLSDKGLLEDLSKRSLARSEDFSWTKAARQTIGALDEAMALT